VSVWQTVLVFVGIPAGIIAVLALGVYGKAIVRQPNRYRPGKTWDYPSQWFVPHPDAVVPHPKAGTSTTTAVGGASGEW
jgi:hypothetical protein